MPRRASSAVSRCSAACAAVPRPSGVSSRRSEEHTSELQSQSNLVCRLLLEKKNNYVCKGFDPALVDFYGKLDGKEMLWCWKVGEERIEHWHELEIRDPVRQPIPSTLQDAG